MKKLYLLLFFTAISQAQIVSIPDANFKAKLLAADTNNQIGGGLKIDQNGDGQIQNTEAELIGHLDVSASSIADLTGIEAFINIGVIECQDNQLTTLNLIAAPYLYALDCHNNLLVTLVTSGLTNLNSLDCSNNPALAALDVTNMNDLNFLTVNQTQIAAFSLSGTPNIGVLHIEDTPITALDVANLQLVYYIYGSHTQITSLDISGMINLEWMQFDHTPITNFTANAQNHLWNLDLNNCGSLVSVSITNCTMLTSVNLLDCPLLASADFSNCTHLTDLTSLQMNAALETLNVSNCPQLGSVALFAADNQLNSLNLAGCTNMDVLYLDNCKLTSLDASDCAALTELMVKNNQLTSLNISDLQNLKVIECSDNQLTSIDLTGLVEVIQFECDNNQIAAMDLTDMVSLETMYCNNNPLTTLDASHCINLEQLSCDTPTMTSLYVKNGMDEALVFNPEPMQYICADDSQIPTILTSIDPTDIVVNSFCTFVPGGNYNTISGTMLFDADDNGCDAGDTMLPNLKIRMTDGTHNRATFTDTAAAYSFYAQTGTFTLTPDLEFPSLFTVTPNNATVNFATINNLSSVNDFCIAANGVHPDLEVMIAPSQLMPGFNSYCDVIYRNRGNQIISSGTVTLAYDDAVLDVVSTSAIPDTQSSGNLSWNYTNLMPFETRRVSVNLHLNAPTDTPPANIGDIITYTSTITPNWPDDTPLNNTCVSKPIVGGSFDPNNKLCLEGTSVSPTKIGDYLHYVINFENTGTAAAQNIVVQDNIDATMFDINSLQVLNTSHPVVARIIDDKVEFVFQNINLAPDADGNVVFEVKTKNTLSEGDFVINTANIYFDYNFPVATNDAFTVFESLGVNNPDFDNSIAVYPNPTRDILNVKTLGIIKSIQLYDIQGRVLQTNLFGENSAIVDISGKQKGIYFLKITSENGIKIEKIIKN
ncbi:MAG TPA: T9SS type A sorting domain-containing protein [Flavobacterium sp.]|nr:T9SS type A sorting domain-containing protein [Flavobacterium sp.]